MAGWEPAEHTTYQWEHGRIVSSVTVREPEWNTGDVAALIAARRRANVRRVATGYTFAEATDPSNDGKFYVRRNAHGVPLPKRDFSAGPLKRAQDEYFSAYPQAKNDPSLVWEVLKED